MKSSKFFCTTSREFHRFLSLACVLTLVTVTSLTSQAELVVANYRQDFRAQAPLTPGWSYLWNQPSGYTNGLLPSTGNMTTGAIGNPANYAPLLDAGSVWSA